MEHPQQPQRKSRGRIIVVLFSVALGIIGDAAVQALLIGPGLTESVRSRANESKASSVASDLIATAHDWADQADRRRAALEAAESARQARIDSAAQDLLDRD